MARYLLLLIILTIYSIHVQAQNDVQEDMAKLRKEFHDSTRLMIDSFNADVEKAYRDFAEYEAKMRKEYKHYVHSIKKVWGNGNMAEDTPTEWVEYSKDFKSRSVVDFDNGNIEIEVAFDNVLENDSNEIDARLAEAVGHLLESRGTTCPYSSDVDTAAPLSSAPILEGIVDLSGYDFGDNKPEHEKNAAFDENEPPAPTVRSSGLTFVSKNGKKGNTLAAERINGSHEDKQTIPELKKKKAKTATLKHKLESEGLKQELHIKKKKAAQKAIETKEIAKAIARQSKKTSTIIKGDDNKERKVVKIEMALVTDNLSKSAALYKDIVSRYSKKFQIEEPLIFAVIEQESRFNPEATSWVPAYGLMQLVPTSGGADAYKFVYKRDWIPTKSYLFVPHHNIELGTAYLRILMNTFKDVKDPDCRRLCVIAGYNTGAGNVSRAFTGDKNVNNAIPLINGYNYQQLYKHLTNRLSTSEARNYVSGVTKRREKYIKK